MIAGPWGLAPVGVEEAMARDMVGAFVEFTRYKMLSIPFFLHIWGSKFGGSSAGYKRLSFPFFIDGDQNLV